MGRWGDGEMGRWELGGRRATASGSSTRAAEEISQTAPLGDQRGESLCDFGIPVGLLNDHEPVDRFVSFFVHDLELRFELTRRT